MSYDDRYNDRYGDEAARLHQKAQAERRERKKESDKDRLVTLLRKKILTAGVGVLSSFEAAFGSLWGEDKNPEERTENERAWLSLFLQVRDEVFDKVNQQIRGMQSELDLHTVEYQGVRVRVAPNHQDRD